ncbi:hypothetical protein Esti_006617 [Eimeria stiedai]
MKRTRKAARRAVSRRPKGGRTEYYDTRRNLHDPILRAKWNNRKSPQANFASFSLADFEHKLANDEALKAKTPEKTLNEMETKIISKLVAKHKTDYTKMSRDTKVNVYQWTAAKCEKLSRCFLRGHCCVSSHKYLSHLINTTQHQQQQQQQQREQKQQAAAAGKSKTTAAPPPPAAAAIENSGGAATKAREKRGISKRRRS